MTCQLRFMLWPVVLTAVLGASALASEQRHQKVEKSESMTVTELMQAALVIAPERIYSEAFKQYANDQRGVSDSLIAAAPRLSMTYRDDQSLDDFGLREMAAGIEFDLWQWGERANARRLADSLSEGARAWQNYLQLMVAGQLREVLHQLAAVDASTEHAHKALADAEKLLRVSQKLLNAGVIARSAVMQSEALVLEARQHLLAQHAAQIDAERSYYQLTGLDQRPVGFSETPAVLSDISARHPQIQFLKAKRRQQAAIVEQQRYQAADNTTVSISMQRERAGSLDPEIDSLGFAISIPFGGASHRRASASAAAVALADADVRVQQAQRKLTMALHEVQHQLEVVNESIVYAEKSRDLLRQRWNMAQKAFSLGESDIQPTIVALRQHRKSQLQLQLLQLQRQALISSFKQTVGELP